MLFLIGWAGFILFLVLFLQRCGTGSCPEIKKTADTVTVIRFDSVPKKITVPKPFPVPGTTVIIEVPANIDTAKILQLYFNKNYYSQIIGDTNLRATITDTISQNSIVHRTFSYQLLRPVSTTTIINKTVEVPKKQMALYAGIFGGITPAGQAIGFGINASLITKKRMLYDIRYDLLQQRIEFGVHFKIQFRND